MKKKTENDIIIAGKIFQLNIFGDKDIDLAFQYFYKAFFSGGIYSWKEMAEKMHMFFSKERNPGEHGVFFNNFTHLWNFYFSQKNYKAAEQIWEILINITLEWESKNQPEKIHKGTAFYFWGITAIDRGDLDLGYALIHKALKEDIDFSESTQPNQPALAIATLNSDNKKNYYRNWVFEKTNILKKYLLKYCQDYKRQISYSDLNKKFLQSANIFEPVFLLSYVLGRLNNISKTPDYVFRSNFSNQIHLNIIFDLTLVIDNVLKISNPKLQFSTFIEHMTFLAKEASINITKNTLGEINSRAKKHFEKTISDLLDDNIDLEHYNNESKDLAVTYILRNKGGHSCYSIESLELLREEIYQSVFNTLFLVIETLYLKEEI